MSKKGGNTGYSFTIQVRKPHRAYFQTHDAAWWYFWNVVRVKYANGALDRHGTGWVVRGWA